MDGFTLASCIASCAEETITYNDTPTVLIGPYFPHETLSIQQFISFRLPSLQTRLKNPSSCLSSKQPSMDTLSEDDLRSLVRPTRLDMKRLEILIPLLSLLQFYDCSIPPSPHPIGPSSDFMSSYILTYILGF